MYGHNPTSVKVAEAAQTNTSKTYFGSMFVMDCPLTTLPNIGSKRIGYAQGMTASASQTELGLLMILHFVFTEREYNGSTISILGRNLVFENVREMPVVGGSGAFRFARGYAEGKTYSLDVKSGNATLEYNGNPQWEEVACVCRWGNNHRLRPQHAMSSVYDVAAHQVVNGAMEGINGTIFAYGVTSRGKTHTMHGDQRSPGIIPLAVKDAFSIIQEVVNDLLNPAGHNLRIREDKQNVVDLAGSESSKVETSGLRRKEGSYINKSLLTLETLTDVKASHVPYRDSKITRVLQSSLSGHLKFTFAKSMQ
ncbi:unnamed protein product [Brassica oleracea]